MSPKQNYTGTSKTNGIGRAIVHALLMEQGARKIYATSPKVEQLEDLVGEYKGQVIAVSLDITYFSAIDELPNKFPDVNLVANNAGYLASTSSLDDISSARKEM